MGSTSLDGEWEATAFAALKDPRSDEYDSTIMHELRNYNARFATTPGFEKLRLHLFKAVLLTESGGPSSIEWTCRPMQIGNPGDPGYDVLREHQENPNIIMSRALQRDIATKSIDHPILNIRAGIALVLTKAARFRCRSEVDSFDHRTYTHVVVEGESLFQISEAEHTTAQELKESNPELSKTLHAGQRLRFRRAHIVTEIAGWRDIDVEFLANRYNGDGDPEYSSKVSYLLEKLA
jgi:LysM domain